MVYQEGVQSNSVLTQAGPFNNDSNLNDGKHLESNVQEPPDSALRSPLGRNKNRSQASSKQSTVKFGKVSQVIDISGAKKIEYVKPVESGDESSTTNRKLVKRRRNQLDEVSEEDSSVAPRKKFQTRLSTMTIMGQKSQSEMVKRGKGEEPNSSRATSSVKR